MNTARIFWSGRSQAVRLPKEFRFDTDEVTITRRGSSVVLEPVTKDWAWLDSLSGTFDDDARDAALEEPPVQERDFSGVFA